MSIAPTNQTVRWINGNTFEVAQDGNVIGYVIRHNHHHLISDGGDLGTYYSCQDREGIEHYTGIPDAQVAADLLGFAVAERASRQ